MCTCIDFKAKNYYFGRNLDLEYRFGERVVVTPRNYHFDLKNEESFDTKYAFIGMANVINNYPLYAEASNEKGLSIAGLNFPGNAKYFEPIEGKVNIAPFELTPWLLGNFTSVKEFKKVAKNLNLTNIMFNDSLPAGEMHWMISDKNESIVLEQTKDGMHVYENPYGVLTNNPEFYYHMMNMNNYMNLSPRYAENRVSEKLNLAPYAQGMGAIGMPGDVSPASRFVRATFNKFNAVTCDKEEDNVAQFFHILDSVAFIKGTVITKENNYDKTTYSCCINTNKGIYYYKTYYNNQINAVKLTNENMNAKELYIHEILEDQNINFVN